MRENLFCEFQQMVTIAAAVNALKYGTQYVGRTLAQKLLEKVES